MGVRIEVDPAEAMLTMVYEAAGNVEFLRMRVQSLKQDVGLGGIADSAGSMSKTNEAMVHIWVSMYDAERERLVKWAGACRAAGVDERMVTIATRQGAAFVAGMRFFAESVRVAFAAAGLADDVMARVLAERGPELNQAAMEAASRALGRGEA